MSWKAIFKKPEPINSSDKVQLRISVDFQRINDISMEVEETIQRYWDFWPVDLPSLEEIQNMVQIELNRIIDTYNISNIYSSLENLSIDQVEQEKLFPTTVSEISQTDQALRDMKQQVKDFTIPYFKANPSCALEELQAAISTSISPIHAALSVVLISIYTFGAASKGLISEASFEALRNFIVSTPTDQLLSI